MKVLAVQESPLSPQGCLFPEVKLALVFSGSQGQALHKTQDLKAKEETESLRNGGKFLSLFTLFPSSSLSGSESYSKQRPFISLLSGVSQLTLKLPQIC